MILSHLTASMKALAQGVALATALALPAAAATMQAVYTGTVHDSNDQTGVFGGTGSSLDGAAFTMTFRYDTTLGMTNDYGHYQDLRGGLGGFGLSSPVFYAALTINGVTRTLDLDYFSVVHLYDESSIGSAQTYTYHGAEDFFDDGLIRDSDYFNAYLGSYDGSIPILLDLTHPFTAELDRQNGSQFGGGFFYFRDYDYVTGAETEFARGELASAKVVVSMISAVPLPAGLPLLAVALGGLALLRRRRVTGA